MISFKGTVVRHYEMYELARVLDRACIESRFGGRLTSIRMTELFARSFLGDVIFIIQNWLMSGVDLATVKESAPAFR